MKRKLFIGLLLSILIVMLTACGGESSEATQSQPVPTVAAAEETATEPAPAEPAATEPAPAPEEVTEPAAEEEAPVTMPDTPYYIPLPETIGEATYAYDRWDEEQQIAEIYYQDADQETLEEYLYYCAACGLYASKRELEGDLTAYYLAPMGQAYWGAVYLDQEKGQLVLLTEVNDGVIGQAQLDAYLAYYEQELSFPAEFGKNVFPQFYASIGEPQPKGMIGESVDYVFDGAPFWAEMYFGVTYQEVRKYLDEMLLCGFDIWIVTAALDDNDVIQTMVLQLSNGDADVVLSYDVADEDAFIYYESGTMWTLLYGEDYVRYIPQR